MEMVQFFEYANEGRKTTRSNYSSFRKYKKRSCRDFKIDISKTRKVLHGIDHLTFRPIEKIKRKPNQLITTASADVPLKGLIYLIRAYDLLLKDFSELEACCYRKITRRTNIKRIRQKRN